MNRLNPDDDEEITEVELIALHLHELSSDREEAVRRAIERSPLLAAEAESIASTFSALRDLPMHIDKVVLDRNWKALRPSLTRHSGPSPRFARWRRPVFAGLVVASAATLAYVVSTRPVASLNESRQAATASAGGPIRPLPVNPELVSPEALSSMPLEPAARAKLGSGVFYAPPHRLSSSIRLLALDGTKPIEERVPRLPSAEAILSATPLTLVPGLPQVESSSQITRDLLQQETESSLSAQTRGGTSGRLPAHTRVPHTSDIMLAMGGTFIVPHNSLTAGTEPRSQTATHAVAALAALHQQFRPALGYRITVSYTRPDFLYSYSANNSYGGFYSGGEINTRIFEVAGTYVIQGPHRRRLSTSADAGAALLAFLPTSDPNASYVYRAGGVLGANMDYAITKHWGARLAYRAQIFRSPDFRYNGGTIPVTTSVTVSNEPALGITYRFGKP